MESRIAAGNWKTILDSVQDMVMVLDTRQRVVWGNRSLREFLALPEEEIIGSPCHRLFHGTETPDAECPFRRMVKSGSRELFEVDLPDKDIRVRVTVDPLLDEGGAVAGAVHKHSDVTSTPRVDMLTPLRSRRLALISRIGESLLGNFAIDGVLAETARELCRSLGIPRCTIFLSGSPDTAVEHREPGVPSAAAAFQGLLDAGGMRKTYESGSACIVNDTRRCTALEGIEGCEAPTIRAFIGVPLRGRGSVTGVLFLDRPEPHEWKETEIETAEAVARQISVAIHQARVLREQKELAGRLLSLMNNVPGVVYRGLRDWSITFVGVEVKRLTGYPAEDFLQKAIRWKEVIHPDDLQPLKMVIRKAVNEKRQFLRTEYRIVHREGGFRWLEDRRQFGYGPDGSLETVDGLLLDITDSKQVEEALKMSEEQFLQSQKMEAVGRLAGGVAHDFNNLLTAIRGYSDLLLQRIDDDSPHRKEVEEIHKAGERASALTRQLLAFSRKQVMQPKVLDLNGVVAGMEEMLRRMIDENIDLITVLRPGLWNVQVDQGQIEQVVMNLVVNARDAIERNGKITIETGNVVLDDEYVHRHSVVASGAYAMLAVSDTGIGMDENTKARLFEPFFTTKEQGKGTGLGLSTVYGIVKQSNGYIWVYSELRRGSTFKIYLPRHESRGSEERSEEGSSLSPKGHETILLVEDEELVRVLARDVLRGHGYTVLEARDGADAMGVAVSHRGPIHLMVTDVVMPNMGGQEVAASLAHLLREMKVLFISGYSDEAIVRHGILSPGSQFLQKPFRLDALLRKVREVLDG
jgi:PAS domain S-box-containing protein